MTVHPKVIATSIITSSMPMLSLKSPNPKAPEVFVGLGLTELIAVTVAELVPVAEPVAEPKEVIGVPDGRTFVATVTTALTFVEFLHEESAAKAAPSTKVAAAHFLGSGELVICSKNSSTEWCSAYLVQNPVNTELYDLNYYIFSNPWCIAWHSWNAKISDASLRDRKKVDKTSRVAGESSSIFEDRFGVCG